MSQSDVQEERPPEPSAIEQLARDPSSRKRFLSKLGGTFGAGAVAAFAAACGQAEKQFPNSSSPEASKNPQVGGGTKFGEGDVGIVNYALYLEYFESDFYDLINHSGLLSGKFYDLSRQIQEKERDHLEALRDTAKQMGTQPVKKPRTKFPLESESQLLDLSVVIENTGPGAYLGQAPRIRSHDILASALAIHTVEARQAAALNMLAGKKIAPDGAFARPRDIAEVLEGVAPYIVG